MASTEERSGDGTLLKGVTVDQPLEEESSVEYDFKVAEEFEPEDIYLDAVRGELESLSGESNFYMPSEAFSRALEHETGKHQPHLYDVPEEERPRTPELPDPTEKLIEDFAREIAELPASGRIEVDVYERDGDPQYIRTFEGEVSLQVLEKFWSSVPEDIDAEINPLEEGYAIDL